MRLGKKYSKKNVFSWKDCCNRYGARLAKEREEITLPLSPSPQGRGIRRVPSPLGGEDEGEGYLQDKEAIWNAANIGFFIIALLFFLMLTGCMVGPDYVKPAVDVPAAYIYGEKEARDTANTEWWKQFQDPVLDDLITEAITNNRDVKIAAANVEQAAAVLIQTRSPLYPQIGYNGSGTGARKRDRATPLPRYPQPADFLRDACKRAGDRPWGRTGGSLKLLRQIFLLPRRHEKAWCFPCLVCSQQSYSVARPRRAALISKQTLAAYGESVDFRDTV
jgi:hypothetical protein